MQCARAMRVFATQVDTDWFAEFIDGLGDIWEEAGVKNDGIIEEGSIDAFVESLGYILPKSDMKAFLGVSHYYSYRHMYYRKYPEIVNTVLDMADVLNKKLGTKSAVWVKPKKLKTKKKREKQKTKKQKQHEEAVLRIAEDKKRKKERLQNIVKAAKAKREIA